MSFTFSESVKLAKNGTKAKPKSFNEEIETTVKTIEKIKTSILQYSYFGIKIRSVDVFWSPMSIPFSTSFNASKKTDDSTINDDAETGNQNKELQPARPPDGVLVSMFRQCHMGLILEAYSDTVKKDTASLIIAIELFTDGIRIQSSFGDPSVTKAGIIQSLSSREQPAYSAGVKRDVDVELHVLLEVVESFSTSEYSVIGFNCQHFTSIVFYRFTGQFLRDLLRRRWTSNHNEWGVKQKKTVDKPELMHWARSSELLMEELEPVEGEKFMYSRSPRGWGKASMVAFAVAAFATGGWLAPLAISTATVAAEKIPSIRRFERSTIWFKFDIAKNSWFWSPYRDGEVTNDIRWIPIHLRTVQHGQFAGSVLENTSATIASTLESNMYLHPRDNEDEDEEEMCYVCLDVKPKVSFCKGQHCNHTLCSECFGKISVCPFCRASYE